ncbi:MAG TPA: DUF4235 domain-containing protein [Jatrophihabitantaceae bacterium]|jgi:hypothetical protein
MANIVGNLGWKITTIAVGIPVGIAAKKGVDRAWAAARPDKPSRSAKDPNVSWGDALGWAALSAVGVAVAELVTMKGASTVWRRLVGDEPPPVQKAKAKAEKKAEKAEAKAG